MPIHNQPLKIHTQTYHAPNPSTPNANVPSPAGKPAPGSPASGSTGQASPASTPPPSPKSKDALNRFYYLNNKQATLPMGTFDAYHSPRRPDGPVPATAAEQNIYARTNRFIDKHGLSLKGREQGFEFDKDQNITWHGEQMGGAIDMPDRQAAARLHTHPTEHVQGARPSANDMLNGSVSYAQNKGAEYFMHNDRMFRIEPDRAGFTELSGLPGQGLTGDLRRAAQTPLPPPDATGL